MKIGKETFDVSVGLLDAQGKRRRRILAPVKTRETEGGGHAHLFTRDITSAIETARSRSPNDFVVAVIVAKNWSASETEITRGQVDHAAIFDLNPNDFHEFSEAEQQRLNTFMAQVLNGSIEPRRGA